MSRFQSTFDRCKSEGRAAVMPYVTAGDPTLAWTEQIVNALIESGADIIELGVPYSDPLADGPTVQAAGQRALQSGTTIRGVFDVAARIRSRHPDVPIALLVYYNCIFRWGEERFVRAARECGIDGLIVPDLPPEEATSLERLGREQGIDMIYLLAPTSTSDRIATVAKRARGFIYCVSVTGVTGARQTLSEQLAPFIENIRKEFERAGRSVPLAVGFGISTPEHAQEVSKIAEGVIVGSALVDRLATAPSPEEGIDRGCELVRAMRAAVDKQ